MTRIRIIAIICAVIMSLILPCDSIISAKAASENLNVVSVLPYPAYVNDTASSVYSITVNGKPVFVHKDINFSYAHFAFAGEVEIKIKVSEPVKKYTLSPLSQQIPTKVKDNVITFKIRDPKKLILHKVNNLKDKLIILADPFESDIPKIGSKNVVDASKKFGVDKTGVADSTRWINKAIESLPKDAILYFPDGKYLVSESINLKSNMTLYLSPGAEIYKSTIDNLDKDIISITNSENVTIKGRGRINGNGRHNRHAPGWNWMDSIGVNNSKNLYFMDFMSYNSSAANFVIKNSTNVYVENTKILSENGTLNSDGYHYISVSDSSVNNVFICNTDDANNFHTDVSVSERISMTNVVFCSTGSGSSVAIAYDQDKGYGTRDCFFENYDSILSPQGFKIKSNFTDNIENIMINNVRFEEVGAEPFFVRIYQPLNTEENNNKEFYFQNINFNNIKFPKTLNAKGFLWGYSDIAKIRNITFNNVSVGELLTKNLKDLNFRTEKFAENINFKANPSHMVNISSGSLTAVAGKSLGSYIISRNGGSNSKLLTVKLKVTGSAINGTDYEKIPNEVTIPAGKDKVVLLIKALPKASKDLKQVIVELMPGNGYMMDKNFIATVAIADVGKISK